MDGASFEALEQAFLARGPAAVFDYLKRTAMETKDYRLLFGARLMETRHELRLPLIETEPTLNLTGQSLAVYENALQKGAREAGELYLADGDIASAWTYFKAIGEPEAVSKAIEGFSGGEQLDRVIEIAFHEGVNPRKGFELILEHHGICRAITLFDSLRDTRAARHVCSCWCGRFTGS